MLDENDFLLKYKLTDAEIKMFVALIKGTDVVEIAKLYGITRATVCVHFCNIFKKIGINRKHSIVAWYYMEKLKHHGITDKIPPLNL